MATGAEPPAPAGATAGPAAGPQIRRREAWVDLAGGEGAEDVAEAYPGFKIRVWANAPRTLYADLASGEEERMRGALAAVVLAHNGWVDYDGRAYPPADSPDFWTGPDSVPTELAQLVLLTLATRTALPKSLTTSGAR